MVSNIHWLGHASFRIEGNGLVIYIGSLVDAKYFKEKASVPVQILPVDK